MIRHLLNVIAVLSLLLALASAGMWVRSRSVTEAWEFVPRPAVDVVGGRGWYTQVALESGKGRLVYVKHETSRSKAPVRADYGYVGPVDGRPPHLRSLRKSMFHAPPWPKSIPPTSSLRIPGVIEWVANPPIISNREYLSVSWLAIAGTFAIPPIARALLWGWQRRHRARPAFAVITPDPA
jgi:hypothetical protein